MSTIIFCIINLRLQQYWKCYILYSFWDSESEKSLDEGFEPSQEKPKSTDWIFINLPPYHFKIYQEWNPGVKIFPEAVDQRCSVKKVFLETSQNSQENTCARASF